MLSVTKSQYYSFWVYSFYCLFLFFSLLSVYNLLSGSVYLHLSVTFWGGLDFPVSISLTSGSSLFSSIVSLISLSVFSFSIYYISHSTNTPYFAWLTVLFVISILIVINFSDLAIVILGWDGLGIVSFFLIVFYQSPSSIFSGVFTLFINRVGDSLLLVSIVLLANYSSFWGSWGFSLDFSLSLILLLGLITNSAIFPFSSWLPAAIAAPTPISSLVHSSTLVTAGLYLMIRFSDYLYSYTFVLVFLCVGGVFTSFYAGLNSLLEVDLNKIVALSTLSHLGFIALALALGWPTLAFIHLLSHAAFNSLLFISLGGVITSLGHYQESRYLSSGEAITPFSSSIMVVSSFSLLGAPFFSGFYSNDLILETLSLSSVSHFCYLVVILNVLFTFSYTFRILSSLFYYSNTNPLSTHLPAPIHLIVCLTFLSIASIILVLSFVKLGYFCVQPFPIPVFVKFYPSLLSIVILVVFLSFLHSTFITYRAPLMEWASTMFFLTPSISSLPSRLAINYLTNLSHSVESGVLHSLLNYSISVSTTIIISHVNSSLFTVNNITALLFVACLLSLYMYANNLYSNINTFIIFYILVLL